MKTTSIFKPDGTAAGGVLWTRVFCDCCPGFHEYDGPKSKAVAELAKAQWSVSSTGTVRCVPCKTSEYAALGRAVGRRF